MLIYVDKDRAVRQLEIVTPDQVVFHLTAAGLATRAYAWFLDQAILLGLKIAAVVAVAFMGSFIFAVIVPLLLFLDSAYYLLFEWSRNGQTPGKKIAGIRVVAVSGARLSFQDVLLRNIVRIADGLPVFMVAGGVCAFLDPLGRRLGDLAAGTMVVHERGDAFTPPPVDRERPNSYRDNAGCRRRILARAGKEDRDLALELMWRREELRPEVREQLFGVLAADFRECFSLPDDVTLSDEQTVMDVALLLAERDDG